MPSSIGRREEQVCRPDLDRVGLARQSNFPCICFLCVMLCYIAISAF